MTTADCGIAAIRTAETILLGENGGVRSRAQIIALLGEPAGTFEDGGKGMLHMGPNLNDAFNPIGFEATQASIRSHSDFESVVAQGNIMIVGGFLNGPHAVVVEPSGGGQVNVYNWGPTTGGGHAFVQSMSADQASRIPIQSHSGATGNVWVITPRF